MGEVDHIHADEQSIGEVKEALLTSGEEYKNNLSRLTNLVQQITNGDIKGELADEFKKKFEEKEQMFTDLRNSIDDAEEEMGIKKTGLVTTITESQSDFK